MVKVDGSNESKSYNVHKIFMAGTSKFFNSCLEENETMTELNLKMEPKFFEAILAYIYAGHAIVDLEDVSKF